MTNNRTQISELSDNVDHEVNLSGWLYRGRSGGKVLFLILRDGTGLCQCIVEKGKLPEETFWLLLTGDVPSGDELKDLQSEFRAQQEVPQYVFDVIRALPKDSRPNLFSQLANKLMSHNQTDESQIV